ncbi:MAG: hypothetical protein JRD89_09250 [Deltaproteobacteria bacterium]|nr:hypothetical protein [Deltaproteobacteria bacterium]
MKDMLMDKDGDMFISSDGLAELIEGADFTRQVWVIKIRTYQQEWFLNTLIGIPYIQEVFTKVLSYARLKQIFNQETLTVPGVKRVTNVVVENISTADREVGISVFADIEGEDNAKFSYTGGI